MVTSQPLALAVHGGSGTIRRESLTEGQRAAYEAALVEARDAGWAVLTAHGAAMDAALAAARVLEDCPLFNAGRGSVYTAEGEHEMDASVMEGTHGRAGAVCGVRGVRHPVDLAHAVMEDGRFVFLCGAGAEEFAAERSLETQPMAWFGTEERHCQWQNARQSEAGKMVMDHDGDSGPRPVLAPLGEEKFGTIGAVACDASGRLAAATSTGGLTNKRFGRVGDSPVIGAGTFAEDETCAISCTVYGEEFIRQVVAHNVSARMRYLGEPLAVATDYVINQSLPRIGGSGGLIAVDRSGRVALPFNTSGMYRAWRTNRRANDEAGVAIFR